jgi:hypothetical protein
MTDYDFDSLSITPEMKSEILNHVFSSIKDRFYQYSINRVSLEDIRPYDVTKLLEHTYHKDKDTLEINYGIIFGKKNYGNISIDFMARKTPNNEFCFSVENITIEFRRDVSFFKSESHFISISRYELNHMFAALVPSWDKLAEDIYKDMLELKELSRLQNLGTLKQEVSNIMGFQDAIKHDRKFFDLFRRKVA